MKKTTEIDLFANSIDKTNIWDIFFTHVTIHAIYIKGIKKRAKTTFAKSVKNFRHREHPTEDNKITPQAGTMKKMVQEIERTNLAPGQPRLQLEVSWRVRGGG